jgi:hypothetical protein
MHGICVVGAAPPAEARTPRSAPHSGVRQPSRTPSRAANASSPLDLSVGGHTSPVGHPDGERHGISPGRYDSTKAYMMRGG